MKFGNHMEQRSPIWPYFQFNSQYNCSAMRSVVDLLIQITVRDRTLFLPEAAFIPCDRNTANQKTRKPLDIRRYSTKPHRGL